MARHTVNPLKSLDVIKFSERFNSLWPKRYKRLQDVADALTAEGSDTRKATVSRWKRAETKPTEERLQVLAKLLGVSSAYLLGEDSLEGPVIVGPKEMRHVPLIEDYNGAEEMTAVLARARFQTGRMLYVSKPVSAEAYGIVVNNKENWPEFRPKEGRRGGDILIVDPAADVETEDFAFIEIIEKGKRTRCVRQCSERTDGGRNWEPFNKAYRAYSQGVAPTAQFKVLGKIVQRHVDY